VHQRRIQPSRELDRAVVTVLVNLNAALHATVMQARLAPARERRTSAGSGPNSPWLVTHGRMLVTTSRKPPAGRGSMWGDSRNRQRRCEECGLQSDRRPCRLGVDEETP
jgi:hypothetical protein